MSNISSISTITGISYMFIQTHSPTNQVTIYCENPYEEDISFSKVSPLFVQCNESSPYTEEYIYIESDPETFGTGNLVLNNFVALLDMCEYPWSAKFNPTSVSILYYIGSGKFKYKISDTDEIYPTSCGFSRGSSTEFFTSSDLTSVYGGTIIEYMNTNFISVDTDNE